MAPKLRYFEPERVNDIFVDLTTLPHCSGHEDMVRKYILRQVEQYNSKRKGPAIEVVYYKEEAREPGERNIILRRGGCAGKEHKPAVILQAHLDMVCVPSPEIFPVKLNKYLDENGVSMLKGGGFSTEDGTTLGADDGIGVAAALALITDPESTTGPLECLFTVQEEVNMGGARGLDIALLSGNTLINLDSEDYDIITYGSAGGSHVRYEWIPAYEKIPAAYKCLFLEIAGLTGGHSGVNINEGKGNALKVMARLLDHLRKVRQLAFCFVKLGTSNDRFNVIPNNAQVALAYPPENSQSILDGIEQQLSVYKQEFRDTDPGITWRFREIGNPHHMLTPRQSHNLLDLLLAIPSGPLKMLNENEHIVETSVNLAVVDAEHTRVCIKCSNRSAVDEAMEAVQALHRNLARVFGINLVLQLDTLDAESVLRSDFLKADNGALIFSNRYPGWQPDQEAALLHAAREVYSEVYGEHQFKIEVVHAGLECGWIIEKFRHVGRKVECIAVGPTVKTPHSWNERLETESVQPFYDCLAKIIEKLQQ